MFRPRNFETIDEWGNPLFSPQVSHVDLCEIFKKIRVTGPIWRYV